MFNASKYFSAHKDSAGIKAVYRTAGLTRLYEMLSNIREIEFPALIADVGCDGVLDLSAGCCSKEYHTFSVVVCVDERSETAESIEEAITNTYNIAMKLISQMRSDSKEIFQPCYGLDVSNIAYSRLGPIGLNCYGCTFNITITRDDVQQ